VVNKAAIAKYGDTPINLMGQGAPSGSVFTRFLVQNAEEQHAQCTEFSNSTCR
jgi:hypothetical protein